MKSNQNRRVWYQSLLAEEVKGSAIEIQKVQDFDTASLDELRNNRKIYLDDDVDEKVLSLQRLLLGWNVEDVGKPIHDRKPIILYICSYGGDRDYMWSLVDTIQASETPVYTVNVGMAYSAAGIIFMAGHRRLMFSNARVMIHDGFAMMAGDGRKVLDASEDYKIMHKKCRSS